MEPHVHGQQSLRSGFFMGGTQFTGLLEDVSDGFILLIVRGGIKSRYCLLNCG
jgi:hypothetical protein